MAQWSQEDWRTAHAQDIQDGNHRACCFFPGCFVNRTARGVDEIQRHFRIEHAAEYNSWPKQGRIRPRFPYELVSCRSIGACNALISQNINTDLANSLQVLGINQQHQHQQQQLQQSSFDDTTSSDNTTSSYMTTYTPTAHPTSTSFVNPFQLAGIPLAATSTSPQQAFALTNMSQLQNLAIRPANPQISSRPDAMEQAIYELSGGQPPPPGTEQHRLTSVEQLQAVRTATSVAEYLRKENETLRQQFEEAKRVGLFARDMLVAGGVVSSHQPPSKHWPPNFFLVIFY